MVFVLSLPWCGGRNKPHKIYGHIWPHQRARHTELRHLPAQSWAELGHRSPRPRETEREACWGQNRRPEASRAGSAVSGSRQRERAASRDSCSLLYFYTIRGMLMNFTACCLITTPWQIWVQPVLYLKNMLFCCQSVYLGIGSWNVNYECQVQC